MKADSSLSVFQSVTARWSRFRDVISVYKLPSVPNEAVRHKKGPLIYWVVVTPCAIQTGTPSCLASDDDLVAIQDMARDGQE